MTCQLAAVADMILVDQASVALADSADYAFVPVGEEAAAVAGLAYQVLAMKPVPVLADTEYFVGIAAADSAGSAY